MNRDDVMKSDDAMNRDDVMNRAISESNEDLCRVFSKHGWCLVSHHIGKCVFVLPESPYNEFSIERDRENGKITVSVPMPETEIQYTTTIADYPKACAFLKSHLENFIEQNSTETT